MPLTGTSSTFTAYGVDGCRAGWFYIAFEPSGEARWGIVKKIESLVHQAADADRIFIDVPIGLPCGLKGRPCDKEARGILGSPRRCSVFPAPARAVLQAESYCEAKRVSQEVTGKKVSKQTFAILPMIKEVDRLLQASRKARRIVREVHPEVCFWGLAECKPMGQSKKRKPGLDQRLEVLSQHWAAANETCDEILNAYPRRELARDDIVDAAVAAITALADEGVLKTLPEQPPQDDCGLPMEMVYVPREVVRSRG